jgi:putative multicomponent Na+:H+ antiporter subunit B
MNHPDIYIYIIVALLPLAACLVVLQVNPYHALALRGILGAIAALVYGILGAADVALTEALMGTLLAITLYAVAVRSSLVLRLGVLADGENQQHFQKLMADFRKILNKRHMRLEVSTYTDKQALQRALTEKEIHGTCTASEIEQCDLNTEKPTYHTTFRIQRIYDIMQTELSSPETALAYVNIPDISVPKLEEQHL